MKKIITPILCLLCFIFPYNNALSLDKSVGKEAIAQCNEVGDVDISLLSAKEQELYKKIAEPYPTWSFAEKISQKTPYTKDDKKVVLQLICQEESSPAAMKPAIDTYYRIWKGDIPHEVFNLCTYITSGYGEAVCASRHSQQEEQVQNNDLNKLKAKLSPTQQLYLTKAYDAAMDFLQSSTQEELHSGSSRYAASEFSFTEKRAAFIKEVNDLYEKKISTQKPTNLTSSDQKLNKLYKELKIQLEKNPIEEIDVSFTFQNLRDTQRQWIIYKDIFSDLAHELNSDISIDDWKFELTQRRNQGLERLLQNIGNFS